MAESDRQQIGDEGLAAVVAAHGAELHSIRQRTGGGGGTAPSRELLWQAGPAWPRHAPVLFPIVGRLAHDTLLHDGRATRMTQHGFARDRAFRFLERDPQRCRLLLEDDADSRESYPFAFRLEIEYRIEAATLTVSYALCNPGRAVLPASLGAHPAFNWPLDPTLPAEAHEIVFASAEPAPIRRVRDGLLRPDRLPSPIRGDRLALDPALFLDDAVILEAPASRSLRYGVPGGAGLRIGWSGFRQLGIWSKPGAAFLCIEPWCGLASPEEFSGEFAAKPHLLLIPPGEQVRASWTLAAEGFA